MVTEICPRCSTRLPPTAAQACPTCGATLHVEDESTSELLPSDSHDPQKTLSSCPHHSLLRRYLDHTDVMIPDEMAIVERHIEECPRCEAVLAELALDESAEDRRLASIEAMQQIGRYSIRKLIGEGGFGSVFLAEDVQLQRSVAIKVSQLPTADVDTPGGLLAEARSLATLDHPNILAVYDFGQLDDGRCYIVSPFVDGCSLAEDCRRRTRSWRESAELVATLAQGLHAAHKRKIIHRDIKPANILLDRNGTPFLADFGLALREVDHGDPQWQGGTLGYLSPEQARGEGHLVDGRSDIFSLGVVLYELIANERPFDGKTAQDMLCRIEHTDPRPPRQIDDTLPAELERICLKCLAKSPPTRYTTAADLADDLNTLLANAPQESIEAARQHVPTITPRGLRPFEGHDQGFFLRLVAGPCDRAGVPESIGFWKRRVESRDLQASFRMGLLYGPSGCGKTSLVRAGLLPQLSDQVVAIYVDAAAGDVESQLQRALHDRFPEMTDEYDLVTLLSSLRVRNSNAGGRKVLLVLDQFEHWFHRHAGHDLPTALRQCDGQNVQGLLLVRDEYWMATTRLFRLLDVSLDSQNCRVADLFDAAHTRQVLIGFGRAYQRLPMADSQLTADHHRFLDACVNALSDADGRTVPVRLAMFVEMVRSKPWTSATWNSVGGLHGLGVRFLDDAFVTRIAPPQQRRHRQAAQRVLRALLPAAGSRIRGRLRSTDDLLVESEYPARETFDELMHLLDVELRLVTPVDCDRTDDVESSTLNNRTAYQLTHDYLVDSLREWLHREDSATFRGRARLALEERANLWSSTQETRQLPSLVEFLRIWLGTRHRSWTDPQRQMIKRAARYHALRAAVVTSIVAGVVLLVWNRRYEARRQQALAVVTRLRDARPEKVAAIVAQIVAAGPIGTRALEHEAALASPDASQPCWLGLAQGRVGGELPQATVARVLRAGSEELFVVQQVFSAGLPTSIRRQFQAVLDDASSSSSAKLRAAGVISFSQQQPLDLSVEATVEIASELVEASDEWLTQWQRYLEPNAALLRGPLLALYQSEPDRQRRMKIQRVLQPYAGDDTNVLATILVYGEDVEFATNLARAAPYRSEIVPRLTTLLDTQSTAAQSSDARLKRSSARARATRAAAALLCLSHSSPVWRLFGDDSDPGLRSSLIARLAPLGVEANLLSDFLLTQQAQPHVHAGLLLALGEYEREALSVSSRSAIANELEGWYRHSQHVSVHAAARWLLQRWELHDVIARVNAQLPRVSEPTDADWYLDVHGNTMAVLGPDEFWMGTPAASREFPTEVWHRRAIDRRFAISIDEVTSGQYQRYVQATSAIEDSPEALDLGPDRPRTYVTWDGAARYCNWLSEQAGIAPTEWCYEPLLAAASSEAPTMQAVPDATDRSGYRLPTEAEWEYACRAGTTTAWFFGESAEDLHRYGWFKDNAAVNAPSNREPVYPTRPIGGLRPNAWGMFDVYGNALEWCHNRPSRYLDGKLSAAFASLRSQRGGNTKESARLVRSAIRYSDPQGAVNQTYGLRLARTLVPAAEALDVPRGR